MTILQRSCNSARVHLFFVFVVCVRVTSFATVKKTYGIHHFRNSKRKRKYYRPKKTILQKVGSLIEESYVDWTDSFIGEKGCFFMSPRNLRKKDLHGAHISIKFFLLTEM